MAAIKLFKGAPFGVQSARFDVSAAMVHAKNVSPTLPEVLYSKYYLESKAHLGPGMYKFSDGCFDEEEVKKAIGTGWAKAQEATRLTQLPHFQFKPIIKEKKFFEIKIGPGSYDYKDFMELAKEKPSSNIGILSAREERFPYMAGNNYPGPGNYGKGGNPYTEMEEKAWDRSHTKGIMCTKAKKSFELSTGGSGLSPGTYTFKSGMEEFLTRTVSKRGPYDLFSGDRSMPIAYGHFATPKKPSLELYSFKSFVDELNSNARKKHGVFGKLIRNPTVPSERIFCSTPSQWPIKQSNLGPGTYDPKPIPRYELTNQHPFGSSSKRVDLKYYQHFIGNTNPVGVGRYNHTKHEGKDKRQRYRSLYLSKQNRYPLDHRTKELVLQQRLTPFTKGKDFQPFDHSCESPPSISWQKCPQPGPVEKA
ncbi:lymphocyte expansion molecule isoform X1 [Sarcophilus harrisii]|uniref:Lymphocyte expansion molecule n=1 Tax=Sarcophilus harrisii TaxID=9305 RepID=G3VDG9_SARHA|nr:lymphocyte expansion molecule isoform X1 [Sarcophilus harrisii]